MFWKIKGKILETQEKKTLKEKTQVSGGFQSARKTKWCYKNSRRIHARQNTRTVSSDWNTRVDVVIVSAALDFGLQQRGARNTTLHIFLRNEFSLN